MATMAAVLASRTKAGELHSIEEEVRRNAPPGKRLVFGHGNPDAVLAIVGEAPGKMEEMAGLPFHGPAGHFLDRLLIEAALDRDDLWITNVIKWRLTSESISGRIRTRAPNQREVDLSRGWLIEELLVVQPRLILCLGKVSARVLIDRGFRISVRHGQWCRATLWDAQAIATLHPAYVLRMAASHREFLDAVRWDFLVVANKYHEIRKTGFSPNDLLPECPGLGSSNYLG